MKKQKYTLESNSKVALVCVVIGWIYCSVGNVCNAQTPPTNLSPDLQEVVKLSQAQMTDDVIVNYIKNTGRSFQLSADDILYLKSQGVSQVVIVALLQTKAAPPSNPNPMPVAAPQPSQTFNTPPPESSPAPQAEAPAPPAQEINFSYFHDQLAPFGTWIDVGGTMYWHPDAAITANPDWRPYYDMGKWVQTDNGLYWQSEYTWGDIPFHYGRWVLNPRLGWIWAPDYTWGPAWVFWRHAEGDAAIGWAPLPVGAVFVDGVFMFNGARVGVDFDFGLGESCFTFVGYDHFHEGFFRMRGREYPYHIYGERFHAFYGRSVIRNEFRMDEHGRFVNNGIGRDRLEHLTHVEHANFEERHPFGDRDKENTRRAEEAHKKVEQQSVGSKPGEQQPEHVKPAGQPAPVSKVFRPPTPASKPVATPKPAPDPSKKESPKK